MNWMNELPKDEKVFFESIIEALGKHGIILRKKASVQRQYDELCNRGLEILTLKRELAESRKLEAMCHCGMPMRYHNLHENEHTAVPMEEMCPNHDKALELEKSMKKLEEEFAQVVCNKGAEILILEKKVFILEETNARYVGLIAKIKHENEILSFRPKVGKGA